MNRLGSPSKRVEDSLDDVVQAADAELSALDRVKRSARSTAEHGQQYAEAKQMFTPELYQPIRRSSSAPRGAMTMSRNSLFEDAGGQHEQKTEEVSMERRFETFLRKQKMMEDRIKRLEHQKVIDATNAQLLQEEREKMIEDHKADHKTILNLRSQVSSLKTKLEQVVAGEEDKMRPTTNVVIDGSGSVNIHDMVKAAVQAEMNNATRELTSRIQKEHQLSTSASMNRSLLSDSKVFSRGAAAGVEQMSSMERELIRLTSEFERIKTRQSTLEAACTELKNTATIREMKAEEAHKRAINAHRVEVESFLGSAARRTADSLATVQAHTTDLLALRSDLDGFTDRAGNALAELDMRISYHDQNKEELYGVIERMERDTMQLKNQTADAESTLIRFAEDSLKLAKVAGTVDSLSRQFSVCQERVETLDVQLQATSSAVDSQAVPIDMLAKSIDGINEKFEARTDALRESIDSTKTATEESLHSISDAVKKNKNKIKELTESLKGVSQIRQSIEAVLREVDNRAKQDASWTYSFKTGLQKVEGRLQAVENALISSTNVRAEDPIFSASEDGSIVSSQHGPAGGMGSGGGPSGGAGGASGGALNSSGYLQQYTGGATRQLPLLGTQFDEIRLLIADLRLEVRQTAQEECNKMSTQFSQLLDSKFGALEDRCTTMVEERAVQMERYSDEQVQSNNEFMTEKLLELQDALAEVQEQHQQHKQEVIAQRESHTLEAESSITALKAEISSIGENVRGLVEAQDSVQQASSAALANLSAELDMRENRLTESISSVRLHFTQSVDATECSIAEIQDEFQRSLSAFSERLSSQENNTVESGTQLNTHITLIDELHTSLGQCQTILEGHENRLNDLTDEVEKNRLSNEKSFEDLSAQLHAAAEDFSQQSGILQDDLHTCKEDLVEHVRFTNDSMGDLQTALDEGVGALNSTLTEQVAQLSTLKSKLSEGLAMSSQADEDIRSLLTDLDVKVTQGHTLLERSVTELEQAVANCENGGRSRISGTEKRLAMQEAAMKERVAGLELKLSAVEDTLRNKVMMMEGSLASQEEQLRDSVPLDVQRAQDAQLASKLNEASAQLIAVKERVSEMEGRMAAQEGEAMNVRTEMDHRVTQHMHEVEKSLQLLQNTHAELQQRQADDMLQAVEERISGIRDLVFQIHELINAQKDEFSEGNQGIMEQLAAVEESIASTDNLLSEHVNHMQSELSSLREEITQKMSTSDFKAVLDHHKEEVTEQLADAASVAGGVAATFSAFEDDCTRRLSELEVHHSNTQNSARLRVAEMEGKFKDLEHAAELHKDEINAAQLALQEKLLSALAQLAARVDTTVDNFNETMRSSEATLLARVADTNQLLQMQEKRLRAVEKGIESKATEAVNATAELRLDILNKLSTLADNVHASVAGNKESTSALTVQMVALQAQINDHADEVRASIDSEISSLKAMISSDMADFSAANTSAARIEDWVTDLQRAHDDHSEHFQSTIQQYENRLQIVEQKASAFSHTDSPAGDSKHHAEVTELETRVSVLQNQCTTLDAGVKQRLTALEQKSRSLENMTKQAAALGSRIHELESRMNEAETASLYITELKANLSDVHEQISECSRGADVKIREIRALIDEIAQPMRRSASAKPTSLTSTADLVRPTPPQEEHLSSQSRPKLKVNKNASHTKAVSNTGNTHPDVVINTHDLSPKERQEMKHVSHMSVSPVRRQFNAIDCDILDQRCELVPDSNKEVEGTESEEEVSKQEEKGEEEEEDFLNKTMKPRKPAGAAESSGNSMGGPLGQKGPSSAVSAAQRKQQHHHHQNHQSDEYDEYDYEDDFTDQFEEQGVVRGGAMVGKNKTMMDTVKFDIAAIGSHLKAFNSQTDVKSSPVEQSDRDRLEEERQAAVESLQLKKLNHRKKFQNALFQHK